MTNEKLESLSESDLVQLLKELPEERHQPSRLEDAFRFYAETFQMRPGLKRVTPEQVFRHFDAYLQKQGWEYFGLTPQRLGRLIGKRLQRKRTAKQIYYGAAMWYFEKVSKGDINA